MSTSEKKKTFKPEIILYWLFPIFGIGVPLIYYCFSYSPVLTDKLAQTVAYIQYLADNSSHVQAQGWTSDIIFLPLTVKYFFTGFYNADTTWKDALYSSVISSYSIMAVAYLLLVLSIRAKKILTYIICAVAACLIGFFAILTSYSLSSFMLFAALLFISAAILTLGIRISLKFPFKIAISVLCVVPSIIYFACIGGSTKQFGTITSVKTELASSFTKKMGAGAVADSSEDCENTSAGLLSFIKNNSSFVPIVSSDAATSNILSVCSERSIHLATAPDLSSLDNPIQDNCALISTDSVTVGEQEFMYVVPNANKSIYEKYLFLSETEYSDEYYTVYSFPKYDYLRTDTVLTDLRNLTSDKFKEYDTVVVSMYDVSNSDFEYFNTFMALKPTALTNVFDDTRLLDDYNQLIFTDDHEIGMYIFCADPYKLFACADFNEEKYDEVLKKYVTDLLDNNKDTMFYIYLPTYSISHFESYGESDLEHLRDSYNLFLDSLESYENLKLYYTGNEEYLYNNPFIYEAGSDCLMNEDVANDVLIYNIADVNLRSIDEIRDGVDELIVAIKDSRTQTGPAYDFSDYCTVICGDSIFALFSGNTSIQNILCNTSNMGCVFRAVGGRSATTMDAYVDTLKYQLDVTAINQALASGGQSNKKLLFILEFGLNDYFEGLSISNPSDKYDEYTFSGILRSSIELIQSEWPGSDILIINPGYITMWENGNLIVSSENLTLNDYRIAAQSVAEEYGVYNFDLCNIGITQENATTYISDDVHYNGRGRYFVANALLKYIDEEIVH